MTIDYAALGFKCGLEIHQQLEGKKLFCESPTSNSDAPPDFKVQRRLRAVAGETGEIDQAAKHEMTKRKKIIYTGSNSDVGLMELDETPPDPMNADALLTALTVAKLLNAKLIDEIQVMRKTVVDGSNVSGFQRTSLIAIDGFIETDGGTVTIPNICIEEESAKKVKESDDAITYQLNRLGIPLIEIATGPEIQSPQHAKEVAAYLGMVLRSVPGVKRGLGTIRQDVNISIKGGARTEVKGFQDLKSIPKVIEHEVERQQNLIKKGKKIEQEVRKAEQDFSTTFLRPMPGAARLYPETDVSPIRITEEMSNAIKLPKLLKQEMEELEKKYEIPKEKIKNLMKDTSLEITKLAVFEQAIKKAPSLKPVFIADTLLSYPSELQKKHKGADPLKITPIHLEQIFEAVEKKEIAKDSLIDILADISKTGKLNLEHFKLEDIDLEQAVKELIKEKPDLNQGAYMGMLMAKFKGKIDGKEAASILQKHLK
jgi:Glu-tRNA(Gln) amidotransferase subunit E-like FAD-binding protein